MNVNDLLDDFGFDYLLPPRRKTKEKVNTKVYGNHGMPHMILCLTNKNIEARMRTEIIGRPVFETA